MVGAMFIGIGKGLSTLTVLGYVKAFSPISVGYFNSGVGFSGIFSIILFIVFKKLEVYL